MRASRLPALFFLLPLVEIVLFGLVVDQIGFWRALALMMLTSVAGILLLRHQGFGLAARMFAVARGDKTKAAGLGYGIMVLIAGLLLMIPGFLTDILGLLLLIPFIRRLLWRMAGGTAGDIRTDIFTTRSGSGARFEFRSGPAGGATEPGVVDLDAGDYHRADSAPGPGDRLAGSGRDPEA
nr:FxsA family protein [uncultured Gellertiella sp.]